MSSDTPEEMPERINVDPPTISMGSSMYGSWTVNQPMIAPTEYVRGDIAKALTERVKELEKAIWQHHEHYMNGTLDDSNKYDNRLYSLVREPVSTHKGGEG